MLLKVSKIPMSPVHTNTNLFQIFGVRNLSLYTHAGTFILVAFESRDSLIVMQNRLRHNNFRI